MVYSHINMCFITLIRYSGVWTFDGDGQEVVTIIINDAGNSETYTGPRQFVMSSQVVKLQISEE